MNSSKIKVLIVDDNLLYRKVIRKSLSHFENVDIIDEASSGENALEVLKEKEADLVLLDIHMPGMGGVQTLGLILQKYPNTSVVLISGISQKNAPDTIMGLRMGALDFIPKPGSSSVDENFGKLKEHLSNCLSLVAAQSPKRTSRIEQKPSKNLNTALPKDVQLIAIGVSTGGPKVLTQIFSKLTKSSQVPILVVQHMPANFTKSLAANLDKLTPIKICEAEPNMELQANTVYFAPGGKHMELVKEGFQYKLDINEKEKVNSCRPSVDVLFESIAKNYRFSTASIMLTGMGQDGLEGVKALKKKGCYSITQSESSCTIYGMPKAVVDAGLSDLELDVDEISQAIEIISQERVKV